MGDDNFRDFFYSAKDGLKLHARIYGAPSPGTWPVVCLPGLTRNARDFEALAHILSKDEKRPRQLIAFDYRGRGRSSYDPNWQNYAVPVEADDVAAGLTALDVEHASFIGTSRGGLIVMALTAMRPALIKAAVLNDIGPVIEGAGLAHIRSYLENAPTPASIDEAVRLQRAVHGDAFSALTQENWERQTRALYRSAESGRPVADFDPRLLKTLKLVDLNNPLPTLWPQFEGLRSVPVLAMRGANSKLLSRETLDEMERRHPRLEALTVEGQGHAPLLETGGLPRRIGTFLSKAERAGKV
ncbi:alpha/beta fold hydrolase [Nitratireductor luteus]|uniref:alpha/beta fold hydrolase n=1 Tax=Nitratireductor luteus TaxID=2976980 RepID=UPI00223F57C1|nr:alpha/beta hydrolase [Nitratireductor luteus]